MLRADAEALGHLRRHVEHDAAPSAGRGEPGGYARVGRDVRLLGMPAGKLGTGALHHHAPRRGLRVARIDQPGPVAGENLEHRFEHVAHHPLEVVGSLQGAVDAVHRLEEPQVRSAFLLGALALA